MAGGSTGQFAAEALNLFSEENNKADYAITGYWSRYAMREAQMFGETKEVTNAAKSNFCEIEPVDQWDLSPNAAHLHYCDNETIEGLEFRV
ncbi:phosphoserine aminotransferase, putative [Eimeria brunetti]|uniref:Phosphoserine aminotransferase, putative n=1 Tax=Eimeria brunetti TaxID=51314 RepID=U6LTK0_9EIME|nr:phosphoserine aminotransferase, putative [Eimeria brunetti]